jgi:hypothetical protein
MDLHRGTLVDPLYLALSNWQDLLEARDRRCGSRCPSPSVTPRPWFSRCQLKIPHSGEACVELWSSVALRMLKTHKAASQGEFRDHRQDPGPPKFPYRLWKVGGRRAEFQNRTKNVGRLQEPQIDCMREWVDSGVKQKARHGPALCCVLCLEASASETEDDTP